ncbi:DUF3631 domain-containing protein [Shinella sp.]|uniref:DUF3631 domain-containing protein n=1 Tax=Shinella sp. TaxID=1870904 RepID=UPI003F7269E1
MSRIDLNRGAGAASTATGPDDAKAASPAFSPSTNEETAPDEQLPGAVSIDGADLLNRVRDFASRFICFPSEAAGIAQVLWAAHTHLMDAWETTPRLAFLSAEPGSGKSLALRITALLSPLALEAANASTASLIRALDDPAGRPAFFIDEFDTKFGPKAKGDEELRCMLNAGHSADGFFLRNEKEKDSWHPVRRSAYAAVALAGIGNILPDTILTRSIVVKMRKRLPGQQVESYRRRDHKHLGEALRDELAAWADQVRDAAAKHRPILPDDISDRDADVWEPLFTVADFADGEWPALARQAAMETMQSGKANNKPSLGVQLLADIRACFGDKDRLPTADLLDKLLADEEAPWGDLKGKKLSPRILAEMLREYDIRPSSTRIADGKTPKGYMRGSFHDAWRRYLPPLETGATSATDATNQESLYKTGVSSVADKTVLLSCGGTAEAVAEPEG